MRSYGALEGDQSASRGTGGPEEDDLLSKQTEETPLLGSLEGNNKSSDRSWWSKLTFKWFTPILFRGNEKRKLDPDDLDLVGLPQDCETRHVANSFDLHWQEELREKENPSLVRALFKAFGAEYIQAGILKLVHDLCIFVGPQVLHAIVVFLRDPDATLYQGLGLTLCVTLSQLTMSLCLRHYFFKCYTTGLRIRTAIVVAVYRKALILSASERQRRTLGEITNLMSIDAQRLQDLTTYLHSIWSSPVQISLALVFLWRQLGASSLGGVSVIIIMIPTTKTVAQWMGKMQKQLMQAKDRRVELNGEVLSGMKVIKFQAWEESFQERIMALRDAELKQLWRYYVGSSFSRSLWVITPLLVALATFAVYILSGHQLDVASALTALALFDILRFPLFMLPQIINGIVEASVALNRLRSFFLCEEHRSIGAGDLDDIGIRIDNLSAVYDSKKPRLEDPSDLRARDLAEKDWEIALLKSQLEDAERRIGELNQGEIPKSGEEAQVHSSLLCLSRINFECRPGELVAVVGGVGCGKTSLINSILGEVRTLCGEASVNGSLAYFSQTPFIMNSSVRDNVLFGHVDEELDRDLYERALSCCALRHDLKLLPDGELTEIGEKGITLSGGQKARVALARAVYHKGDISIIDDALSAVDAHVAKQLFEEAILTELLGTQSGTHKRAVVLITNALQFLNHPRVNRIVVLREGRIVEEGTYHDLTSNPNSLFARFIAVLNETNVSGTFVEGCEIPKDENTQPSRRRSSYHDSALRAEKGASKLVAEETRESGHVSLAVYMAWFRAAGGMLVPVAILASFAMTEGISILSNWWLTYWSRSATAENQPKFLFVYACINFAAAIAGLLRMLVVVLFSLRASRELFSGLLSCIIQARMSFFDTTPLGRLINRFSKDIYTIDEQLATTLRTYLQTLFNVLSTIVVISGVTPLFAVCLIPICAFYLVEQQFFTLTYRELKRLDSVSRSPIYALLGESVDGTSVIRAFSAQGTLTDRLVRMLNTQQHAYYLTCTAQSWLAIRLELMGTLIITFASLNAVIVHEFKGPDDTFAGLAGLAISYALGATQSLNWSVRMASDMEANMVAVERVLEYSEIESEGDRCTEFEKNLPPDWPTSGEIEFSGTRMRYRPGLPLVLKGLDIKIPPGRKIGIVGRTGAGKSTLMVSLLRIVECEAGNISIDGADISMIGLAKLRRNLAVIPQDPVLFSGTIRSNLDPFGEYTSDRLLAVLENVGIYKGDRIGSSSHSLSSMGLARVESLDDEVVEGGMNFSTGQRQLIVIARALLRSCKVVIMDEATSSIDTETDAAIQSVLRTEFAHATCLIVAHRIPTIMDSDFILVMDDGIAKEFDTPQALIRQGGLFRDLVKAAAHE